MLYLERGGSKTIQVSLTCSIHPFHPDASRCELWHPNQEREKIWIGFVQRKPGHMFVKHEDSENPSGVPSCKKFLTREEIEEPRLYGVIL
eukprot:scaffold4365_cov170-Amphora_coffeaeformis.AAC.6